MDFIIRGFFAIRCDSVDGSGRGFTTFVRKDVPFRELGVGQDQKYVSVEIWTS